VRPAPTPFSRAQKDGRECIACAAAEGELVPDGYVFTPGLPGHGWAVVAHPTCRTAVSQEEQ
jgi:hypothetical protein